MKYRVIATKIFCCLDCPNLWADDWCQELSRSIENPADEIPPDCPLEEREEYGQIATRSTAQPSTQAKESPPYFAIGNEELEKKPPLGTTVRCRQCGEYHDVEYGKEKDPATGEMKESQLLAFYKCPKTGQLYLAGIDGREV